MITKNKSDDDPENSDDLEQKIDSYVNAMVRKIIKHIKFSLKTSNIITNIINTEETNAVIYATEVPAKRKKKRKTNSGLNVIQNYELCDTGAVLCQLTTTSP